MLQSGAKRVKNTSRRLFGLVLSFIKRDKKSLLAIIFGYYILVLLGEVKNINSRIDYSGKNLDNLEKDLHEFKLSLLGNSWVTQADGKIKLDCNCKEEWASFNKEESVDFNPLDASLDESNPSHGETFWANNKNSYDYTLGGNLYQLHNPYVSKTDGDYYYGYSLFICNDEFCDRDIYGDLAITCTGGNCVKLGASEPIFIFPYHTKIYNFTVRESLVEGMPGKLLHIEANTSNGMYKELIIPEDSMMGRAFFFNRGGLWDGMFPYQYNVSKVADKLFLVEVDIETPLDSTGVDKRYMVKLTGREPKVTEYAL